MRIALISGGSVQDEFASGFLAEFQADRLIAADSGLDFCIRSGWLPDLAVGDFDSLRKREILPDERPGEHLREETKTICPGGKEVRLIRHRPEKDATDTELAVRLAEEAGADEICILGATGTRLDHVWANLSLLYRLRQKRIRGSIVDAHNRISMPLENPVRIKKEEQFGHYVSILPYGGPVTGLTLSGFKYPLTEYTLMPGAEPLCVSNEIREEKAWIRYAEGTPVVIESKD